MAEWLGCGWGPRYPGLPRQGCGRPTDAASPRRSSPTCCSVASRWRPARPRPPARERRCRGRVAALPPVASTGARAPTASYPHATWRRAGARVARGCRDTKRWTGSRRSGGGARRSSCVGFRGCHVAGWVRTREGGGLVHRLDPAGPAAPPTARGGRGARERASASSSRSRRRTRRRAVPHRPPRPRRHTVTGLTMLIFALLACRMSTPAPDPAGPPAPPTTPSAAPAAGPSTPGAGAGRPGPPRRRPSPARLSTRTSRAGRDWGMGAIPGWAWASTVITMLRSG